LFTLTIKLEVQDGAEPGALETLWGGVARILEAGLGREGALAAIADADRQVRRQLDLDSPEMTVP
jgi:hypothetical protein